MNKKLVILCLSVTFFLILFSPNVFASVHIYNSTAAGTNFWGFHVNTSAGNDGPPVGPYQRDYELATSEYTDMEASNDQRIETGGGGAAINPAHTFEFKIDEDVSTISKIDFYWEGYGDKGSNELYFWNWTDPAAWVLIGSHGQTTQDGIVTGSNISELNNVYVNSSGYLIIVAVDSGNKNPTFRSDLVNISVTYAPSDATPPTWSQAQDNSSYKIYRGDVVNISTVWEDDTNLDFAWLWTNETDSTGTNYTEGVYGSPRDISGTGPITVNFTWQNQTGEPRVIGWIIYANDTSGKDNSTLNQGQIINFTMWGWSNITWTSPDGGSVSKGDTVKLVCFVNDTNTTGSGPIAGYDVYFYNESASGSSYLGVNYTNSTGHAIWYWDTSGLSTEDYYPKCNITDNSTLYYNASEYYQANTTIAITGIVEYRNIGQSISLSLSAPRSSDSIRMETLSIAYIASNIRTQGSFVFLPQSMAIQTVIEKIKNLPRAIAQSLQINTLIEPLQNISRTITQSLSLLTKITTDIITAVAKRFIGLSINISAINERLTSGFRTFSQSLGISETATKIHSFLRALSQSIGITDAIKSMILIFKNTTQPLNVNVVVSNIYNRLRAITQAVNMSVLIGKIYSNFKLLTQSFALNTAIERIQTFLKTLPQSMAIQTVIEKIKNLPRMIAQSLQINTLIEPLQNISRTITQSLSLLTKITTDVILALTRRFVGLSINISAINERLTSGFRTFSQSLGINGIITRLRSIPRTITQAMGISDVISMLRTLSKTITQSIGITNMIEKSSSLSKEIAQFFNMNSVIERVKSMPKILSETLNINDAIKKIYSSVRILSQTLSMNAIATKLKTIFRELSQSLTANAVITRLATILRQTSEYFTTNAVTGKFTLISKLISQSFSVSSLSERIANIFRLLTQTLNANILTGRIVDAIRNLSQNLGLTNVATRLTSVFRTLTQSISILSQITSRTFKTYERIVNVALSISQMVSRISFMFRSTSQSLNIGNITTRLSSFFRTVGQAVNLMSIVDRFRLLTRVVSQSFSTTSLITRITYISRTIPQSILVATSAIGGRISQFYERIVSTTIMVSDIIRRLFYASRTMTGSFVISDVMTRLTEISRVLSQSLNITGFITSMTSQVYEKIFSVYFAINQFVQKIRTVPRTVSQATNLSLITSRVASVFRNIFSPIWLRFRLLFPPWMFLTQSSCESVGYYWCSNACQSEPCDVPTTTVPSGGGPPITGGPIVVAKRLDFTIDKDFIKVVLKPDGIEKRLINISNTGDTDLTMTVNLKNLEDFLVFPGGVSEYTFDLGMGKAKSIQLNFFVSEEQEPGVFPGEVVVTGDGIEKVITVVVEIESMEALFDIDVEIPQKYKEVLPGEEVLVQLIIYNVKRTGRVDVDVEYGLQDLAGNVIVSEHETLAVEMQVSIARSLDVPFDIEPGNYVLYATVKYDGTVGTGSDIFRAITKKGIGIETSVILSLTAGVSIPTIIVVTLILYKRNYKIYVYRKNLEIMKNIKKRMRKRG